ncbi:protein 4.1b isoform X2 [Chanos chanos]|uniref:Protein 4.1 n=1 Tax=Chanos chanos TaxID=29144 RepID=A0A6J2W583_CHACN|nr:trichohyalin-like isoform X2 [Chanos chanos]
MLRCRVTLLDDTQAEWELEKNAVGQDLFDRVCDRLNLLERDYFGLAMWESPSAKAWLDGAKQIHKQTQASVAAFTFNVKFYPPDPDQLAEDLTRYLLCLQLRRDIVNGRLSCPSETLAILGSYTVQSEFGDYDPELHDNNYLNNICLAPSHTQELEEKVMKLHRTYRSMSPAQADILFLQSAKDLPLYGVDLHPAMDENGTDVFVGLCHEGLMVYTDDTITNRIPWPRIVKISYKRKIFHLRIRPSEEDSETALVFTLSSHRACKRLWKTCGEHHSFFRNRRQGDTSEGCLNLSSKLRYRGRTHDECLEASSNISRSAPTFTRSALVRAARRKILPALNVRSQTELDDWFQILSPAQSKATSVSDDGKVEEIVLQPWKKVDNWYMLLDNGQSGSYVTFLDTPPFSPPGIVKEKQWKEKITERTTQEVKVVEKTLQGMEVIEAEFLEKPEDGVIIKRRLQKVEVTGRPQGKEVLEEKLRRMEISQVLPEKEAVEKLQELIGETKKETEGVEIQLQEFDVTREVQHVEIRRKVEIVETRIHGVEATEEPMRVKVFEERQEQIEVLEAPSDTDYEESLQKFEVNEVETTQQVPQELENAGERLEDIEIREVRVLQEEKSEQRPQNMDQQQEWEEVTLQKGEDDWFILLGQSPCVPPAAVVEEERSLQPWEKAQDDWFVLLDVPLRESVSPPAASEEQKEEEEIYEEKRLEVVDSEETSQVQEFVEIKRKVPQVQEFVEIKRKVRITTTRVDGAEIPEGPEEVQRVEERLQQLEVSEISSEVEGEGVVKRVKVEETWKEVKVEEEKQEVIFEERIQEKEELETVEKRLQLVETIEQRLQDVVALEMGIQEVERLEEKLQNLQAAVVRQDVEDDWFILLNKSPLAPPAASPVEFEEKLKPQEMMRETERRRIVVEERGEQEREVVEDGRVQPTVVEQRVTQPQREEEDDWFKLLEVSPKETVARKGLTEYPDVISFVSVEKTTMVKKRVEEKIIREEVDDGEKVEERRRREELEIQLYPQEIREEATLEERRTEEKRVRVVERREGEVEVDRGVQQPVAEEQRVPPPQREEEDDWSLLLALPPKETVMLEPEVYPETRVTVKEIIKETEEERAEERVRIEEKKMVEEGVRVTVTEKRVKIIENPVQIEEKIPVGQRDITDDWFVLLNQVPLEDRTVKPVMLEPEVYPETRVTVKEIIKGAEEERAEERVRIEEKKMVEEGVRVTVTEKRVKIIENPVQIEEKIPVGQRDITDDWFVLLNQVPLEDRTVKPVMLEPEVYPETRVTVKEIIKGAEEERAEERVRIEEKKMVEEGVRVTVTEKRVKIIENPVQIEEKILVGQRDITDDWFVLLNQVPLEDRTVKPVMLEPEVYPETRVTVKEIIKETEEERAEERVRIEEKKMVEEGVRVTVTEKRVKIIENPVQIEEKIPVGQRDITDDWFVLLNQVPLEDRTVKPVPLPEQVQLYPEKIREKRRVEERREEERRVEERRVEERRVEERREEERREEERRVKGVERRAEVIIVERRIQQPIEVKQKVIQQKREEEDDWFVLFDVSPKETVRLPAPVISPVAVPQVRPPPPTDQPLTSTPTARPVPLTKPTYEEKRKEIKVEVKVEPKVKEEETVIIKKRKTQRIEGETIYIRHSILMLEDFDVTQEVILKHHASISELKKRFMEAVPEPEPSEWDKHLSICSPGRRLLHPRTNGDLFHLDSMGDHSILAV